MLMKKLVGGEWSVKEPDGSYLRNMGPGAGFSL